MAVAGARCCWPGSNGPSGRRGDPTGRRMTGCRGCLGLLVVLALAAWLIEQLQPVLGWSNAQTGGLLLAGVALLAIGSSRRGRGGPRPARLMTVSGGEGPGGTRCARPGQRPDHADGWRGGAALRSPPRPPGERAGCALSSERRAPGQSGGHPVRRQGQEARDPLPARLRFGVLQRDGFRCRYCGRPGSAPGVVLHVDHVVPLAAGGATTEDNLLTACEECNLGKATRAVLPVGPGRSCRRPSSPGSGCPRPLSG